MWPESAPGGFLGAGMRRAGSSGLVREGGIAFVVAMSAVNLSNFVFHVVISRLLGPSGYGALGALLNVVVVATIPLGAIQAAVTRTVANERKGGGPVRAGERLALRRTTLRACGGGALAMACVWVAAPALESFLHLGSPASVVILGTWLVPAVAGAVLQGALMGERRFAPVAWALIVGTGVTRLAVGIVLVEVGMGLNGAIAATAVSQAVTTAVVVLALLPELRARASAHLRVPGRDGLLSLGALGGVAVLTSVDTFLARHFLLPAAAGNYTAAATAGRIAMFLPGTVTLLAFPRFAAGNGRDAEGRRAFGWSFGAVGAMGLLAAGVIALLPGLVVDILFGSDYHSAPSAVGTVALAGAFLGLVGLLAYYHLARNSPASLLAWPGAALACVLIWLFHGDIESVALAMVGASASVLLAMSIPAFYGLHRARGSGERAS